MQQLSEILMNIPLRYACPWHETLMRQWHTIMQPLVAHLRLERLEPQRIVVGVYNPRWLAEFHTTNWMILERIRMAIPEVPAQMSISCIWVRARALRPQGPHIPVVDTQDFLVSLSDAQQDALGKIQDPELRQVCAEYWRRCAYRQHQGRLHE